MGYVFMIVYIEIYNNDIEKEEKIPSGISGEDLSITLYNFKITFCVFWPS